MIVRTMLAACIVFIAGFNLAGEPAKKIIEWGWDEPDTKFIRENIEKMELHPFDGLIFHVVSSKGGNLTWEMWGGRGFDLSEFRHSVDNLKATKFHRFTDRFLRVNVTPGKTDWFDDLISWENIKDHALFYFEAEIKKDIIREFRYDFTPWPTMNKITGRSFKFTTLSNYKTSIEPNVKKDSEEIKTYDYNKYLKDIDEKNITLKGQDIGTIQFKGYIFDLDSKIGLSRLDIEIPVVSGCCASKPLVTK